MTTKTKTSVATAPLHAVIPASDLARAEEFYGEKLGMEIERDKNMPQFRAHAGEGTWMLVYQTSASHGSATQAGFEVRDIHATMAELREHGVTFEDYEYPEWKTVDGIASFGDMHSAWFKDSEGNVLSIFQSSE